MQGPAGVSLHELDAWSRRHGDRGAVLAVGPTPGIRIGRQDKNCGKKYMPNKVKQCIKIQKMSHFMKLRAKRATFFGAKIQMRHLSKIQT